MRLKARDQIIQAVQDSALPPTKVSLVWGFVSQYMVDIGQHT